MADANQPFVSAVVAACNAEAALTRRVDHLQAQDYPTREVIVVDNGSTDAGCDIASRYPVTLLHETRRGHPAAPGGEVTEHGEA